MEELIFIDWKSDVGFKWLFAREAVAGHLVAFLRDLDLRMIKYLIRGIESSGGISHVLVALMNFKFSGILGTFAEGAVVKVHKVVKKGIFVTVELGRFDKSLEELETGLDCWLFLFKNITKLKSVPEEFRGTIFEKIMEMSRIKSLP